MNSLEMIEKGIIGSRESLLALENMESARILIVSDSHGSYLKLKTILTDYASECDALVFCGDTVADTAAVVKEASADIEFQKIIPPVIFFVRGNTDMAIYTFEMHFQKKSFFEKTPHEGVKLTALNPPDTLVFKVCGHSFFVTHGHLFSVNIGFECLVQAAVKNGCDCALFGHTHVSVDTVINGIKVVNPGSCAFPRSSQTERFAIATVAASFIDVAEIAKMDGKFSVCR